MKIYNIGSLNIDYVYNVPHFVSPGETLSSNSMNVFPGGKGLNQSIALARAGSDVIHCGLVGKDGQFLLDIMKESGVNVDNIKTVEAPTGHAIIQVNNSGQNCILLFPGANHMIDRSYIENCLKEAKSGDIVLLQNETSSVKDIFEIANQKGLQIAFNPSPFDGTINQLPLHYVRWWFCNEIEAECLFGKGKPEEIANKFAEKYPNSNLILTLGKDGCIFKNETDTIKQPIYPVHTVDTTAAGDTFSGYFISAIAQGKDVSYALKYASKASSIAVSRNGASSSIPYRNEIIID